MARLVVAILPFVFLSNLTPTNPNMEAISFIQANNTTNAISTSVLTLLNSNNFSCYSNDACGLNAICYEFFCLCECGFIGNPYLNCSLADTSVYRFGELGLHLPFSITPNSGQMRALAEIAKPQNRITHMAIIKEKLLDYLPYVPNSLTLSMIDYVNGTFWFGLALHSIVDLHSQDLRSNLYGFVRAYCSTGETMSFYNESFTCGFIPQLWGIEGKVNTEQCMYGYCISMFV
jgi:hypothetical protein